MAKGFGKKIAKWAGCGVVAALCYIIGGNCYNALKHIKITAEISGQNNRVLDEEFYNEFESERRVLEARMKHKDKDKPGVEVSLNLYVNPMLKYFYDDTKNPNDNDAWTKEVESAVSGLETFENLGYDFMIENIYALPAGLDSADFYTAAYFIAEKYEPAELNISFVTNPSQKLTAYERINSKIRYGKAFIGGDYGTIYMINNTNKNRHTLAHETGHMLGLDDENSWEKMLDPGCFFFVRLMTQNPLCESYSLNENELGIIEKAKERFK